MSAEKNRDGQPRNYLTVSEAGRELGFAPSTIRKAKAQIGFYCVGRSIRFPRENVEAFKVIRAKGNFTRVLHVQMHELNLLSQERENRMANDLQKLERRLAALEAAQGLRTLPDQTGTAKTAQPPAGQEGTP
jgi:excisionase family DNA binding protein